MLQALTGITKRKTVLQQGRRCVLKEYLFDVLKMSKRLENRFRVTREEQFMVTSSMDLYIGSGVGK